MLCFPLPDRTADMLSTHCPIISVTVNTVPASHTVPVSPSSLDCEAVKQSEWMRRDRVASILICMGEMCCLPLTEIQPAVKGSLASVSLIRKEDLKCDAPYMSWIQINNTHIYTQWISHSHTHKSYHIQLSFKRLLWSMTIHISPLSICTQFTLYHQASCQVTGHTWAESTYH